MADTFTTNLGLLIADTNDPYNYPTQVAAPLTTLDSLFGLPKCTSATRPSTTFGGQGIYETDTGRVAVNVGTKAAPSWLYVTSGILTCTSGARPTLNLFTGMMIYETDTGMTRVYKGAAWQAGETVCTSAARPANPITGDSAYESDTGSSIVYTGSAWALQNGAQTARSGAVMPGAFADTIQRNLCTSAVSPTSGTLVISSITLELGEVVGHIGFGTGATAAVGPTHWWVCLLDQTYKLMAHSADQTTTALPASTWQKLATIASYTATYSGTFYLGLMVATGTTQPTILCRNETPDGQFVTGTNVPTPVVNGLSSTGLTTPGTDGTTTYAAPTAASQTLYMYAGA